MDWKEEFSVGITDIDKEHKVLVHCVTDIEDAATRCEPSHAVQSAIERLVVFLRIEFFVEESQMRTFNYPDVAAHTKAHEQFMADVKGIEASILRDPPSPERVKLLRQWLENHFMAYDRQFAAFFQQHCGEGDKPINEQ